jgi:hypothetical protein
MQFIVLSCDQRKSPVIELSRAFNSLNGKIVVAQKRSHAANLFRRQAFHWATTMNFVASREFDSLSLSLL